MLKRYMIFSLVPAFVATTAWGGIIDFESFASGTPMDGTSIGTQYLASDGVTFSLISGGNPVLVQTGNGGSNVFVGHEGFADTLKPDQPSIGNFFLHDDGDTLTNPTERIGIVMDFATPMAVVTGMVLDMEPRPTGAREAWEISAFDTFNNHLGTIMLDGLTKNGSDSAVDPFEFLFDSAIIDRVTMTYAGDVPNPGYGWDNFYVSSSPVPEPGSMLLLAGVGLAGVARRRKQKSRSAAPTVSSELT